METHIDNILKQAHVIVGGCTGSGKSVAMNNLLNAVASDNRNSFILIDNKITSFKWLKNANRCLIYTDNNLKDIKAALNKALFYIENRYKVIANNPLQEKFEGAPIYIFIDELPDLLIQDKRTFLPLLQRIAQIGRAADVHLIVGTQDFSKKLLDSLKNNLSCKIALKCNNASDSRCLLGVTGAQNLSIGECIIQYNGDTFDNCEVKFFGDQEKISLMQKLNIAI